MLKREKAFSDVLMSLELNGPEGLSKVLEKNVVYTKKVGAQLIWQSIATGDDRELLRSNWKLISEKIAKYYGAVKVVNLPGETEEERKFLVTAIELFAPKTILMSR